MGEESAALLDNMCTELLIILKNLLTAFCTCRHVLPALIRLSRWNCFMQQKLGGAFPLCARLSSCTQLSSLGCTVRCSFTHLSSAPPRLSFFSPNLAREMVSILKPLFHISHLVKSPPMKCLEKRGSFKQKKKKYSQGKTWKGLQFYTVGRAS